MVFESVLVSILNKVLGDYVENLDTNQLSVGIWSGDVELQNLVLKQSALEALDLPVQCIYGRIGKLVLQIPWKNLYSNFIVINVQDIYLIAVPNVQVKYDPIEDAKRQYESKVKDLEKIEEAKKQANIKDKPKMNYTFAEKLITQVIKNIQLNINNIHFRYEDETTNPRAPFTAGVTLGYLEVVSTDAKWNKAITYENVTKIFKVVTLDGLGVYWNCNSKMYNKISTTDMLTNLRSEIACQSYKPANYSYILGPINSTAQVKLNQRPELDSPAFSIPKIDVNVVMEKLYVGVTKAQYHDVIALSDSIQLMQRGIPYRKYRPDVPSYIGYTKVWWKFAITCITQDEVKRRKDNWDWNHILEHRSKCREYGLVYQKKLRNIATSDDLECIKNFEEDLDVFNLVLIRQKIELETERLAKVEDRAARKSFFGWIWGSTPIKEQEDIANTSKIIKQFEDAMTVEEKKRLYSAIDYHESAMPAQYPIDYIDIACNFLLKRLEIELTDNRTTVLISELEGVLCQFATRSSASALSVHMKIDDFSTFGMKQDNFTPQMITAEVNESETCLLDIVFETNPKDETCHQRLHLSSQPLKIVYDARTIIKVVDVFRIQDSSTLNQIQAVAGSGFNNFKEMSATGMQHVIEGHSQLDLKINFNAPYIILPHGGQYTGTQSMVVVNLGNLKIQSADRSKTTAVVQKLHAKGLNEEEILQEMREQSYDRFDLELKDLQILFVQSGEDWMHYAKSSITSDLHILHPISLNISFAKSLIQDDPRLPFNKVRVTVPSIISSISDARLLQLFSLIYSVPLPVNDSTPTTQSLTKVGEKASSMMKYIDMQGTVMKTKALLQDETFNISQFVQFTLYDVQFAISEVTLNMQHESPGSNKKNNLASFSIKSLECDLLQQTYNIIVSLRLGSISLQQYRQINTIDIISTPLADHDKQQLFAINFTQVDKQSPEFHSTYKSCETSLTLEFSRLGINLHQQGLLELMAFATNIQDQIAKICNQQTMQKDRFASAQSKSFKTQLSTLNEGLPYTQSNLDKSSSNNEKRKGKNIDTIVETIKFKIFAHLQEVSVRFTTDKMEISFCAIREITTELIMKIPYTQIIVNLKQISIIDLNTKNIHSVILSVAGEEALSTDIVLFNLDENEVDKTDISVRVVLGGLKIIVLYSFVSEMLSFLDQFQSAQSKLLEASQAAAETAKANMQEAYQKDTKIALHIDLKAPFVIIPMSSTSRSAVLLDLGKISLKNTFLLMNVPQSEKNAIIDEIQMSLSNLKVSTVTLEEKEYMKELSVLLEPVTINLIIKRNLSSAWFKGIPDVDVFGKLNTITVILHQKDYQLIMGIVSKNLSEDSRANTVNKSQVKNKNITSVKKSEESKVDVIITDSVKEHTVATSDIHTTFKISFTMDKLVISLIQDSYRNKASHKEKFMEGLATFSLECFALKCTMRSDNSLVMSLLLVNCTLDDMREGRENKICRLIERSEENLVLIPTNSMDVQHTTSSSRSMIDITFQMKNNDMFLDVRMYSMTIILSVDYLMKIAAFFDLDNSNQTTKTTDYTSKHVSSNDAVKPSDDQLTIDFKIEKPDIILVENMDELNTNALVLNSEVIVKFRRNGPHQVIKGSINDFEIFSCCYNPSKKWESKYHILDPVTINLAGSTPQNKGLHVELIASDIKLSVSPGIIELLNRVLSAISGVSDQQKNEEKQTNYSEIWACKRFNDQTFWFLQPEMALEAVEESMSLNYDESFESLSSMLEELCIVTVPVVIFNLEEGSGPKTVPMLTFESSFNGFIRNWSSKMTVEASLKLQMGYYNSKLAVWEHIIEPIQTIQDHCVTFEPWEIKVDVAINNSSADNEVLSPSIASESTLASIFIPQPNMSIEIMSEHPLEVTITKTCLEVANNLGKAFASAMKSDLESTEVIYFFKVVNDTGCSISLQLNQGSFYVYNNISTQDVILEQGTEIPLQPKSSSSSKISLLYSDQSTAVETKFLCIRFESQKSIINIPVSRADKRYFKIKEGNENSNWELISDITIDGCTTVIALRSILQVHNDFHVPIDVYYMTAKGNELVLLATLKSGHTFNVPLYAVYTRTNELFFCVEGYSVTTTPYIWKILQTDLTAKRTLYCSPKMQQSGYGPFVINAVGKMIQVLYENTTKFTMHSVCYDILLKPAAILKNCLPVKLICCAENIVEELMLNPGDSKVLPNLEPGKSTLVIRLPDYLEKEWSCRTEIAVTPMEYSVWSFKSYDSENEAILNLGMNVQNDKNSLVFMLYCPFWMLNKTGEMLSYKSSDHANAVYHPGKFEHPILFSSSVKNFFGKKKASIRIRNGSWSNKFSIDVAGSSGVVDCKADGILYQIGVHMQLTHNGLTKQITFTPYYVIINNAPFMVECRESDRPADQWLSVEPNSCAAFWPRSELTRKQLNVKVHGTVQISTPFVYNESHTTLLKLTNEYGGVNVDIQVTEGGVYINLAGYDEGMAPARIINHTNEIIHYWEKHSGQVYELPPAHYTLYTWENPSGSRLLMWESNQRKEIASNLCMDEAGEFTSENKENIFWISFLDGMQRVLLFTDDTDIAVGAQNSNTFETIDKEINCSIRGIGVSFVNNIKGQEIMYIGIASSGIIWEYCRFNGKRYKEFNVADSALLERAYQNNLISKTDNDTDYSSNIIIESKFEVDPDFEILLKPHKRKLHRKYQTGLWTQIKTSSTQLQVHAKINRLQIDNQVYECIFPVVLAPVPPPKSVAASSGIKPFIELSVVQLLLKNSQIKQFKYFKVLIQEFHVKVDLDFINDLVDMLTTTLDSELEIQQQFLTDLNLAYEPLYAHVSSQSLQEQKSFYDSLHLSPLKIHVSFSMATNYSSANSVTSHFLNALLQGLGVTLTDVNDIVFRLAFFERNYNFLTQKQLLSEIKTHYAGQLIKQLYVLVFGLDVLGNPYGLVVGITKGVEAFFYEPIQGAIQGPGEFAEGLVLGVRSLFGHTVGGAAAAASRITGAVGKGIAALTFDKDYQRKRRDQISKKPLSVHEGFARSGKGLVMGVVDGVTGVFTKPFSGAKEEGVGGFFKGLGKGAVGLVTRPTAGVVDFASGSLDAVKRATDIGDDTSRLRPPRLISSDGIIRPYNRHDASGYKLLMELEKGKYSTTDNYVDHFIIIEKKEILLLTNQRLAYITHNDVFGGWQVDWFYTWADMKEPARLTNIGVCIPVANSNRRKPNIFGSADAGKIILIADPLKKERIFQKIETMRTGI